MKHYESESREREMNTIRPIMLLVIELWDRKNEATMFNMIHKIKPEDMSNIYDNM